MYRLYTPDQDGARALLCSMVPAAVLADCIEIARRAGYKIIADIMEPQAAMQRHIESFI